MWHLTLYGKPDCPLCDEAKNAVQEFAQECELELKWIDITQDPDLWKKYQFEIPVLWIEGREAARHHVGIKKLRVLRKRWEEGKDLQIHETGTGLFPKV